MKGAIAQAICIGFVSPLIILRVIPAAFITTLMAIMMIIVRLITPMKDLRLNQILL